MQDIQNNSFIENMKTENLFILNAILSHKKINLEEFVITSYSIHYTKLYDQDLKKSTIF